MTFWAALAFEDASGSTALVDTVMNGFDGMRNASNPRKALIVISDGIDNHSRHSIDELMRRAVEADLPVYTVSFFDPAPGDKAGALADGQGPALSARSVCTNRRSFLRRSQRTRS